MGLVGDEVVADMITGQTLAPMQCPEIVEVMVEPGDSAHLGTEHTGRVLVLSDGLCLCFCVVASEDLHDWLRTHDDRSNALSVAGRNTIAEELRQRLITFLRTAGDNTAALRLEMEGFAGCPTKDDIGPLADMLEGMIILQVYDLRMPCGGGSLLMHVALCFAVNGAGHASGHYEIFNSWRTVGNRLKKCRMSLEPAADTAQYRPPSKELLAQVPPSTVCWRV